MFDLISVGDIKLDAFISLDDSGASCKLKAPEQELCLAYGTKIAVKMAKSEIAGTAPNVAVGLARMGLKTAVMANMGEDQTHEQAISVLKKENVSTKFIRAETSITSAFSLVLNYKGERTVLTSHPKHPYKLPDVFPKTKWLYIGEIGASYEKMYQDIIKKTKNSSVKIAMNPGSIQIQERKKGLFQLIKQSSLLFVNKEESQILIGKTISEIKPLIEKLWELNQSEVVITDGKNGSYHFDGKTLQFCPIFPGKVVGTIGAGDAFATGFLGCHLKKLSISPLVAGSINSSSVVGFVGPQEGLLSDKEILAREKNHRKLNTKLL